VLLASLCLVGSAHATTLPVEPYAQYDAQSTCSPAAKKGTVALGRYLVRTYGGRFGRIGEPCTGRSVSEHKEGRAFDWMVSSRRKAQRARAYQFLRAAFATGPSGQPAELARRMGIMYVIFNDHIYASYDHFAPRPYRSEGCASLRKCSATLRHLNHVHISLTRAGAAASTSWYVGRVPGAVYVPPAPDPVVPPAGPGPYGGDPSNPWHH